jgi:hypothetical protein
MTIVNEDSRVVTKHENSLPDDTRVVIYDRHMFIAEATELVWQVLTKILALNFANTLAYYA